VKIIKIKKKITPLIVISLFILLSAFNISSGIAIHMQGDGATFNLDKADPVGYGVYIPAPNMYTTMSISGSNQGEFVAMDWLGGTLHTETVNHPGNDVSNVYPWYFENYLIDSTTNNNYINPWSVEWLNVSANNAESDTLSPFTLNSVYNYYVMAEGGELIAPINNSVPMQIDLLIDSGGPKILKFDWLTDNPAGVAFNYQLVSPSGKIVMTDYQIAQNAFFGAVNIFNYIAFVANNVGTYRLLVYATYTVPGYLNLKFLPTHVSTLPLNQVTFGGVGDENPSSQEMWDLEWQSNWFKITGQKGDLFRLDLGVDYVGAFPVMHVWLPCENRYIIDPSIAPGVYELYLPSSGDAYVSFNDAQYGMWYRFSLVLSEIEVVDYDIGDPLTNVGISMHDRKAIEFTLAEDSFIRFNYTEWGDGNALVSSMGINNGFIFQDAKKLNCFEVITPLETKTAGNMIFYYYYFPAGVYKGLIKNGAPLEYSVLQVSSKYVDYANATIPITSLSYPLTDPTSSVTAQFEPDVFYSSLKQGQWLDINVAETGQYRLNWSIYATDNLAQIPTAVNPSVVLLYNDTSGEYIDYTTKSVTYLQSFDSLENPGDFLYIAFPSKWHDIEFNLTTGGSGGAINLQILRSGFPWGNKGHADNTGELNNNGSLVMTLSSWWEDWIKGVDSEFDIEGIDEDDYYWVRLECSDDYQITIPEIDLISLSNVTIRGDVNFALVRDSGYEYCDFWTLTAPSSETGIIINQESAYDSESYEEWLFGATSDPYIIGLEEGNYKLLVIPEQWSHPGSLGIRFSIEDYWGYHVEQSYTIDQNPVAHSWQIGNMVNVGDSILYNYSTYPYDFSITYNDTEVSWAVGGNEAYVAIQCSGKPYSWTQLTVGSVNVSDYNLYILQDLPWLSNSGPYQEKMLIDNNIGDNNTIEFGVIRDNFTLLFEINGNVSPNEMVTLNIGIRQYNTTALYASEITATYTPPGPDLGPLILTLLITIPAGVGAVVVVYVLKKKGKILTKHPT